jgi:hypothetical protein
MEKELCRWLEMEDPNYQNGISILEHYSANKTLIYLLSLGKTRANFSMLREELYDIKAAITKDQAPVQPVADQSHRPPVDTAQHAVYIQLRDIMKTAFKRANYLHIKDLQSNNIKTREAAAKEILILFNGKIAPITNQIQYYEQHGTLPEHHFLSIPVSLPTPKKMMQEILNLRTKISRYKTRADKSADIIEWTARIEMLQKQIDAI